MPTLLNGFEVAFAAPSFTANVLELPDPEGIAALRKQHEKDWFLYWRSGKLYAISRAEKPASALGKPTSLRWAEHEHLHLLVARINDLLPQKFPDWTAFRLRPFAFIGRKGELVSAITEGWTGLPPLVAMFKIHPTFELDPRII